MEPRYVALEVLGEGGMGQVQRVRDELLGRAVARKVMHPDIAGRPDGVDRFLREARVQGRLEHPAVVPVYDLGFDPSGLPWFTMKQVHGLTLEEVLHGLARGDAELAARFPRRRLLTSFVQVCRAIDFAHSRGVLHRDLKPANVMLGSYGDVHVLDWGLARVEGDASLPAEAPTARPGSVFGTPGYMAPEQVLRRELDERADVYSLGAMLFEVLTLRPMFEGEVRERLAQTVGEEPAGPSQRAPEADVPPELDVAVVDATRRDVSVRTKSARELAEAVERYLDGDRDLELRRALAVKHLERAAPLIARLDELSTADRELALHEVNAALALDPGNQRGLELLRRLLTHVPRVLPAEVEQAQREAEGAAYAEVARTVSLRMLMWLALVPLVWAMGPTSAPVAAVVVAAIVASCALGWWAGRRRTLSVPGILTVLAVSALPLLGASIVLGSFMLVPALASTGMVLAASYLRPGTRGPVIVLGVLVVLGPFALAELGVIDASYVFANDEVLIRPNGVHLPPDLTRVLLVAATITTLALPSVLAGRLRDRLASAERRLLLTAWHVERLGQQRTVVEARPPRAPGLPTPPARTLADSTP